MRVTDETTPSGEPLINLADFIANNDVGIKVVSDRGEVILTVDSTAIWGHDVLLDPDEADDLADTIKLRALEARQYRGEA